MIVLDEAQQCCAPTVRKAIAKVESRGWRLHGDGVVGVTGYVPAGILVGVRE
jgi:hypothetical protein